MHKRVQAHFRYWKCISGYKGIPVARVEVIAVMSLPSSQVENISKEPAIGRARRTRPLLGLGRLALWVLLTTIVMSSAWSLLVVLYAIGFITPIADMPAPLQILLSLAEGLLAGSIVAAGQWAILYRQVKWAGKWFIGTVIGWTIGGGVWWFQYFLLGGDNFRVDLSTIPLVLLVSGIASGTTIGLAQWWVMRQSFRISLWWVVVSAGSWALGAMLGYGVVSIADFGFFTYLVFLALAGATIGMVTGLALPLVSAK